eukprot:gene24849-30025_t
MENNLQQSDSIALLVRMEAAASGTYLQGGSESLIEARAIYSLILTLIKERMLQHQAEEWWQKLFIQSNIGLSLIHESQGKLAEAEACLRTAIKSIIDTSRGDLLKTVFDRLLAVIDKGKTKERNEQRIVPENLDEIRNRCEKLISDDKPEELLLLMGDLERRYGTLAFDNLLPSLYNYRGVALFELNRIAEASVEFEKAVEYNKRDINAWMNLYRLDVNNVAYIYMEALTPNVELIKRSDTCNFHDYEFAHNATLSRSCRFTFVQTEHRAFHAVLLER